MEKLGYGWDTLHKKFPKLIYAAASGFGHSGPDSQRPAYDMVVQGMGGIMSITGQPGGPPMRIGMSIGDIGAGLYTCIGVNSALYHRAMTGEATKVDIGMFDCQLALLENAILRYFLSGKAPGPLGVRHPNIAPFEAFDASDGYIIIAAGNDSLFVKLCAAIGRPELAQEARFKTNDLRLQSMEELKGELEKVLKTQPVSHWLKVLDAAGIPAGPINNVGQAIESPQAKARNMIVTTEDPLAGAVKLVGNPIKLSGFPDPATRAPAPELDGDRARILKSL
jgi:CoA:oxalate CoA-transferase